MFINKTFAVTRNCVLACPRTPERVITAGLSPYISWLYYAVDFIDFCCMRSRQYTLWSRRSRQRLCFVNNGHTHTVLPFISMIYHNKLYILVAFLILIRIITSFKHNLFSPKTRPVCALDGFNYD